MSGFVAGVVGGIIGFFIGGPMGAIAGFGIGMGLGMMMDMKMPGPKIGDAQKQTAQAGIARPKPYGHPPPFKGNHMDGEDIARLIKGDDGGGKGSPSAPEPDKFLMTYAIRVCEGPISGYVRIWRNEVVVLDNRDPEDFPEGWEGYSSEVKVAQSEFMKRARLYLGDESQLPDPALEALAHNGVGNTPYHRGTAYIVLEDEDVTDMQGAIAEYKFEVTTNATATVVTDPDLTLVGHWPMTDAPTLAFGAAGGVAQDLSSYGWDGTYNGECSGGGGMTLPGIQSGGMAVNGASGHLHTGSAGIPWATAITFIADIGAMQAAGWITTKTIAAYWGYKVGGWAEWMFYVTTSDGINYHVGGGFTQMNNDLCAVEDPSNSPSGRFLLRHTGEDLELWKNGRRVAVFEDADALAWPGGADGLHVGLAGLYGDYKGAAGSFSNLKVWAGFMSEDTIKRDAAKHGYMDGATGIPDGSGYYVDPVTGEIIGSDSSTALADDAVYLKDVEQDIMRRCKIPLDAIDLDDLDGIIIPGFLVAEQATGADVLTPLLQCFLHDLPEVDGKITAVRRGQSTDLVLAETDFVRTNGEEYDITPQNMEFPLKLSVITQSPEADYAPLPQTSLRFTPDVESADEISIPLAVPLSIDATAQLADKLHMIAWARAEGKLERTLPEKYSTLVVSDTFYYRDRRWIVQEIKYDRTRVNIKCDYDPIYAYTSNAVGVPPPVPSPPTGMTAGPTIAMVMNLPPLLEEHTIGVYIAIMGLFSGWPGADFYLSTDDEETYVNVGSWTKPCKMGQLTDDESGEPLLITLFSGAGALSSANAEQAETGRNWFVLQRADDEECEVMSFLTPVEGDTDGDWELSSLTHSIKGTPHSDHLAGDGFTSVDNLFFLAIPREHVGKTLYLRAVTKGTVVDANEVISFLFNPPDSMLDPGPHLLIDDTGDYILGDDGNYLETA